MFGFLRPTGRPAAYRQVYARCCSFQHLYYGVGSLPLLSYEAIFLYLAAVDAGVCPPPDASAPTCCRLRTSETLRSAPDAAIAELCASVGLLLAEIKLDDDVRDDGFLLSRVARRWLRSRFRRARRCLSARDPEFDRRVDETIGRHLELVGVPKVSVVCDFRAELA